MIDYAQKRYEARDCDQDDDLRYELEQDAREAEAEAEADDLLNGPCVGPYRCSSQ